MKLPDGWEKTDIGECVSSMKSGLSRLLSETDIGLPMLRSCNIGEKYPVFNNLKYWYSKDPQGANTQNYILSDGDILVNFINSISQIGKSCIFKNGINRDCIYTTNILRLVVNNSVVNEYLFFVTQNDRYNRFISTITKPAVNQASFTTKDLKKFRFLLPPLPEQKAIAHLLSTWDEAIEKTQRLIQAKEQFKIGQLQGLITNNKANSTIGAFAKPIIRKVAKPSEPYVALGIRSHFKGTFQRKVEDPNSVSMDTLYKVKKDDLILNITFAWEGAIALVKEEDEKCYVSHRFPTYIIIQKKAEASFIRQLILSSRMKYDLSNISPGGAGRNRVLNKKDFLKMPTWVPDLKKQKNIGELLGTLDKEIDLLKQLAEKYKTQKRGLMQKLLTGDWRIKPEILNKYKEA